MKLKGRLSAILLAVAMVVTTIGNDAYSYTAHAEETTEATSETPTQEPESSGSEEQDTQGDQNQSDQTPGEDGNASGNNEQEGGEEENTGTAPGGDSTESEGAQTPDGNTPVDGQTPDGDTPADQNPDGDGTDENQILDEQNPPVNQGTGTEESDNSQNEEKSYVEVTYTTNIADAVTVIGLPARVEKGSSVTFEIKAENGYKIDSVTNAADKGDGIYEVAVANDAAENIQVEITASVAEDTTEYYTVKFWKDKKETVLITTQEIRDGESAVAPADPAADDGMRFAGWDTDFTNVTSDLNVHAKFVAIENLTATIEYVYKDGGTAAQPYVVEIPKGTAYSETVASPVINGFTPDQESVTINITADATADFKAKVTYSASAEQEVTYTVEHWQQNVDDDDYTIVATDSLEGKVGEKTAAEAKEYAGFTAGEVENVTITPNAEITVVIRYTRNYYDLTFNTDGGTYIAPQRLKFGATVAQVSDPVKTGHTFTGWTDEQGTTVNLTDYTMPAGNTTLTAQWTPVTRADYTVVYWVEKVGINGEPQAPGDYDYVTSKTRRGTVGETIEAADLSNRELRAANYDPIGLERDSSKESDVKITADGTAVKNVYYDRKTFTLSFYEVYWDGGWLGDWAEGAEIKNLRITAKYGTDISKQWNDSAHSKYDWATEPGGSTKYTMFSNMPAENIKVYQSERGTGTTITYYVESLSGGREVYQRFTASDGVHLTEEDKQPIDGFSFDSWNKNWGDHLWLYYTRNSYTISFENCTGISDETLKFEEPLKNARPDNDSVKPPAGVESDYTFGGWYTSPTCEDGTEVDWNSKMPSHNLQVYAKWVKPQYTVKFELNGGTITDGSADSITVEKYDTIKDRLPDVEKGNYEFQGWFVDEACTQKFVEEQQITKDMTLYAKWLNEESIPYVIKYIDKDTKKEIKASANATAALNETVTLSYPDIEGYYPEASSKQITIREENQEVILYYTEKESWNLTVYYRLQGTEQPIAEDLHINNITDTSRVIYAKGIEGYRLADNQENPQTATREKHELTFYYVANEPVTYKVQYLLQDANDLGRYNIEEIFIGEWPPATMVTAPGREFPGYVRITSDNAMSAVVKADGSTVIQVKYNLLRHYLHVNYYYHSEDGTPGPVLPSPYTDRMVTGEKYTVSIPEIEGFVAVPSEASGEMGTKDVWVQVTYHKDSNGNDIPDCQEIKFDIIYRAGAGATGSDIMVAEDVLPGMGVTVLPTLNADESVQFGDNKIIPDTGYKFSNMEVTAGSVTTEAASNGVITKITGNADNEVTQVVVTVNYEKDTSKWLTVTFDRGEHGKFVDSEDSTDVRTNILINSEFPEAPAIVAEDGWVFTGWEPALPATVTESKTYTAQYEVDENGNEIPDKDETKYDIVYVAGDHAKEGSITVGTNYLPDTDITELPGLSQDKKSVTFGSDIIEAEEGFIFGEMVVSYEPADSGKYVAFEKGADEAVNKIRVSNKDADDMSTVTKVIVTVNFEKDEEKWHDVVFMAGDNGRLEGITEYRDLSDGQNFYPEIDIPVPVADQGFAFDKWLKVSDENGTAIIGSGIPMEGSGYLVTKDEYYMAAFAEDKNGDNIPDKYQTKITFKVVNGTFEEEGTVVTEVTRTVELKDALGIWSEDGIYTVTGDEIPKVTPDNGYDLESGEWDIYPIGDKVDKEGATYTLTFAKGKYPVRVQFFFDGQVDESLEVGSNEEFGSVFTGAFEWELMHNEKHYVLDRIENNGLTVSTDPDKNIVKVYYAEDSNSDEIPDKYQVPVTFGVVNGIFTNGSTQTEILVPIGTRNDDGTWVQKESYVLQSKDIPVSRPADGYFADASWSPRNPIGVEITEEGASFIVSYTNKISYNVTVEYYFDNVRDDNRTETNTAEFESIYTVSPDPTVTLPNGRTYNLESIVNNDLRVSSNESLNVIKVYYVAQPVTPDPDPDPDGGDEDDDTTGGGGTTTTPTTPADTGVLGERVEVPADTGVLGERVPETEEAGVLGERRGAGTGDETPIFGWVALAGCAAAALAFVGFRKRKEK